MARPALSHPIPFPPGVETSFHLIWADLDDIHLSLADGVTKEDVLAYLNSPVVLANYIRATCLTRQVRLRLL